MKANSQTDIRPKKKRGFVFGLGSGPRPRPDLNI